MFKNIDFNILKNEISLRYNINYDSVEFSINDELQPLLYIYNKNITCVLIIDTRGCSSKIDIKNTIDQVRNTFPLLKIGFCTSNSELDKTILNIVDYYMINFDTKKEKKYKTTIIDGVYLDYDLMKEGE